jgi:hypothetical protein
MDSFTGNTPLAPGIARHRSAEDRRGFLVDSGIGDRHPNSIVRIIVSAKMDSGQAVAFDKGSTPWTSGQV